jgi:hypothetical protein
VSAPANWTGLIFDYFVTPRSSLHLLEVKQIAYLFSWNLAWWLLAQLELLPLLDVLRLLEEKQRFELLALRFEEELRLEQMLGTSLRDFALAPYYVHYNLAVVAPHWSTDKLPSQLLNLGVNPFKSPLYFHVLVKPLTRPPSWFCFLLNFPFVHRGCFSTWTLKFYF